MTRRQVNSMPAQAHGTPRKHLLTVGDYHRMAEVGILSPELRVELIGGEIIDMAPIGSRHAATINRLTHLFGRACGEQAIVAVQNPVLLGADSEPQPDLALLRPRDDFYAAHHPGPEDVLLIVEVADTTLGYDRNVKLPLYARHGISETWLIDLEAQTVTSYSKPGGDRYHELMLLTGHRAPLALPGCAIPLTPLFVR